MTYVCQRGVTHGSTALHAPFKPSIANIELQVGEEEADASALYHQVVVDKAALASHIRQSLQQASQVTLAELCKKTLAKRAG